MLRLIVFILGLAIAAAGGVITYRALFLEPSAAVFVTDTAVREVPDTLRVAGGAAMLIAGALLAFLAARRKRS
jgi:drug/metabolite transporter (DMT)-like permease